MKKLLFALLLIPSISLAVEQGEGRYVFENTSQDVFILDTKTGKAWSTPSGASKPLMMPVVFMCVNDRVSFYPSCQESWKAPEKLQEQ